MTLSGDYPLDITHLLVSFFFFTKWWGNKIVTWLSQKWTEAKGESLPKFSLHGQENRGSDGSWFTSSAGQESGPWASGQSCLHWATIPFLPSWPSEKTFFSLIPGNTKEMTYWSECTFESHWKTLKIHRPSQSTFYFNRESVFFIFLWWVWWAGRYRNNSFPRQFPITYYRLP